MPPLYGDTAAVLILDEDTRVARLLERPLSEEGYRCSCVSSVEAARAELDRRNFALAFVDLSIPEGSGLEFVEAVRHDHPDLAVIFVSGIDDPNIVRLALDSGAYGYLVKPFDASDVRITAASASRQRCLEIAHGESDRERLEEQATKDRHERLLHQSRRLESLGQLAGGVAHDFNNILAAISNYAAFVEEEVHAAARGERDRDWPSVGNDVEQIRLAADRAARLTHQLLAFARREVIHPEILDLNDVIGEVKALLERTLGDHVELHVELDDGLPPVEADRGQIEHVLVNLVVNARDAMPEGGSLTIASSTVVVGDTHEGRGEELKPGRYACLRVTDTGSGMTTNVRERAFEPFFTTKARGEGSGLGLATVYGIITQSGGSARLLSDPGAGVSFVALLPASARRSTSGAPDPSHEPRGGSETVLLVEDEDGVRDVSERILRRGGYRVLAARSGDEALELAGSHEGPIELLVSDVVMPGLLGNELADRLAALRPDLRVLYISGYSRQVLDAHRGAAEEQAMLAKPFTALELLRSVRLLLDDAAKDPT